MLADPASLAQVYLAGFAAEHLLTTRRPRELDVEVGLAVLACKDPELGAAFGVEGTDGWGAVQQVLRTGVREVEDEIRGEIERVYDAARDSLGTLWAAVDGLAVTLLKVEELDRDALRRILGAFSRPAAGSPVLVGRHAPRARLPHPRSGSEFPRSVRRGLVLRDERGGSRRRSPGRRRPGG
jgi:hypothetical protein